MVKTDHIIAEMKKLAREIEAHNHRYYALSQPVISDKEYDDLLRKLVEMEKEFPEHADPNSPSQRIGVKMDSDLGTVKHRVKMYSLDNTYSIDEIKQWHERICKGLGTEVVEYVAELKIDGVSAAITYVDGELILGATRGDGTIGDNVTPAVRTIRSLPLKLSGHKDLPAVLDVRAEIYMDRTDFLKLNLARKKSGEPVFANPRNATSGSVKLLDTRETASRHLKCLVHSVGIMEGAGPITTQWEFLNALKRWGLPVSQESRLCKSLEEVTSYCLQMQSDRMKVAYDIDGIVIKVNSLSSRERLGFTSKSPRWAVAYKFPASQATTRVAQIKVQVGRTGVLTPVAELEPVECAGVTISRVTLHNFDEVRRLGIKKGDTVLIERAGDVIPKVLKVVVKAKGAKSSFPVPQKCPECGGAVSKESDSEVAYRCVNPSCPKQLEKKLIHFASRSAMDIEGLGESVVRQMLEKGLVRDLADIYYLRKEDLISLDLFADRRAENLIKAISLSKERPLSKFIFALGILNVGEKTASVLAQNFKDWEAFSKAKLEEVKAIHEIGETIGRSVVEFVAQPSTKVLMEKFKKAKVTLNEPSAKMLGTKLSGKKFLFTGELAGWSRAQAADVVRGFGGEIAASIGKKVDYVVVGKNPGSKYQKAVELGVTIINEQQFKELIDAD